LLAVRNFSQFPEPGAGLAEVVAVNGKGDGHPEQGGTPKAGPEEQTPVMKALAAKDT
jgi:hypothetical protein